MALSRFRTMNICMLTAATLLAGAGTSAGATELTCERIPRLLGAFFQKHIDFTYLDGTLRSRAVDTYLKRIDPSKTLYLRDEIKALRASMTGIFHDVYSGNCKPLEKLQVDVVKRTAALETFVRDLLSREDYAVDPDVTLILDPDKRGHPIDPKTRDALYEKLVHFQISNYVSTDMKLEEAKQKLTHRYELMTKRAREVEAPDLYAVFIDAFASSMDPHSHYYSEEAWEDFQIDMNLSLDGIGVALSSRDGYSVVEKIIPGGATDRLDVLQARDKIIAVAQEDLEFVDVIDMDLRDVVRLIRGKRGTKVHLRVLRQGDATERLTVTIERDKINLEERSAKMRVEEVEVDGRVVKIGILDLPSFYGDQNPSRRQSSRDVRQLLAIAAEKKVDGLLLDLSRNGGGLLQTAVEIAGFFIRDGGVVAVKDTDAGLQIFRDSGGEILFDGPMAVLTSRVSASASEIVAGALKDHHRAIVVGDDHTFGKGTVQNLVRLPPGLGALKVTTSMYFRPGGASTQHAGVAADILIPSLWEGEDFGESSQPYSLPGQEVESFLAAEDGDQVSVDLGYNRVSPESLAELRRRSGARIAGNPEFDEIRRKVAEAREKNGVIRLSEILKQSRERKQKQDQAAGVRAAAAGDAAIAPPPPLPGDPDASEEDDHPTPQQQEALRILADFVVLSL